LLGSLFTLVHLPFMLSFLSLVIIGAAAGGTIDAVALVLSLAVVGLLLYAEHMLDETTRVGKPWNTVLGDSELVAFAAGLFVASLVISVFASFRYGTEVPLVGVVVGILFTVLYGLEVKGFHTTGFGGIGIGAVMPFSYLAQTVMLGENWDPIVVMLLLVFGSCYGYVLLSLYENTKTGDHRFSWRMLGFHFLTIYSLAAASLLIVT
jgi:hypothetical protein